MKTRNYESIKKSTLPSQLADEHWEWVVRWLEIVYKDAFVHGYKHGLEEKLTPLPKREEWKHDE